MSSHRRAKRHVRASVSFAFREDFVTSPLRWILIIFIWKAARVHVACWHHRCSGNFFFLLQLFIRCRLESRVILFFCSIYADASVTLVDSPASTSLFRAFDTIASKFAENIAWELRICRGTLLLFSILRNCRQQVSRDLLQRHFLFSYILLLLTLQFWGYSIRINFVGFETSDLKHVTRHTSRCVSYFKLLYNVSKARRNWRRTLPYLSLSVTLLRSMLFDLHKKRIFDSSV